MSERGNVELLFAIILTILAAIGLALIGGQGYALSGVEGFPGKSGVIAPLLPTPDRSKPFQQGNDTSGVAPANQIAIATATSANTKPMTVTSQVAPTRTLFVPTPTLSRPNANTPTPIRVIVSTQKRSWVY